MAKPQKQMPPRGENQLQYSLTSNLKGASFNTLSSLLIGEAAQSLNLSGFSGQVFTATGATITQQLFNNISTLADLLTGFNIPALIESFGVNLGNIIGSQLGNSVVNPTSVGQALFDSVGGAARVAYY